MAHSIHDVDWHQRNFFWKMISLNFRFKVSVRILGHYEFGTLKNS